MRNKIASLLRRVAMIEGLSGQDLTFQNWSYMDLSNANLSNTIFNYAELKESILRKC